jgi:hypothetical protein
METWKSRLVRILAMVPLLAIIGCGGIGPYPLRDYEIGRSKEASVGSVMMAWEYGQKDELLGTRAGIRKELYYRGIAQNVINISYREFRVNPGGRGIPPGTYARPDFNQELKYDISKSKTITFQDVRIEVESADQEKIRFKVIKEASF